MNKSLDWQIGWKHATILGILIGMFLISLITQSSMAASYWLDENGTSLTSGLVGYWKFSEGFDGLSSSMGVFKS